MVAFNGSIRDKASLYIEPFPPLQKSPSPTKLDAGLRSLDHYRNRLPSWRYAIREKLIPLVRWETHLLAAAQQHVRSPALDSYFSITANLGTHTFFLIFLPMLFWCNQVELAQAIVTVLASGVFFSGMLKDALCLPRPLSPPLHRISMHRSTMLEYGFPSTHATNAVSIATYMLLLLSDRETYLEPQLKLALQIVTYSYATSILLGRLYCGMHGIFDIVIGSALGAAVSALQFRYGRAFAELVYSGTFKAPLVAILSILLLVRIHPEPADDCPCFDDSVSFAGVVIGMWIGSWRTFSLYEVPKYDHPPNDIYIDDTAGLVFAAGRIAVGVLLVIAWKEGMKPALLRILPPLFRIVEKLGLSHARRFFKQASDYTRVPIHLKVDNVIPPLSDFSKILNAIRHPKRNRSVSVGPQSAADAYETLAYMEMRRRESKPQLPQGYMQRPHFDSGLISPEDAIDTPSEADGGLSVAVSRQISHEGFVKEKEEREMFAGLEKPRVRYDVEVVTKLIVYAGIAWIAVEGGPLFFDVVGLGAADSRPS